MPVRKWYGACYHITPDDLVSGDSFLEPQTLAWPLAGETCRTGHSLVQFQSKSTKDPLAGPGSRIPNALVRAILTSTSVTIGRAQVKDHDTID
ncbi:3e112294-19a4-4aee-b028-134f663c7ee8-CDS [Sclerotinia trifoliorum]|uniref:3e112294-19a4-4aee-b028-134f663c7ee8-CDS n=1 Tax=Sclerotinia trifoliorum TaxID=28548 RepID=A0A8H2W162_9HELO|nr:3e112294-19a4-4aee-b028-134f663c7ee8-CDS [Sclerotinia trifoliorum]